MDDKQSAAAAGKANDPAAAKSAQEQEEVRAAQARLDEASARTGTTGTSGGTGVAGARSQASGLSRDQIEKDAEMEANRGPGTVNNPRAPEAIAKQHQRVDDELAKRNEQNQAGHDRNMQRIEDQAGEAHTRTERADDPRAGHTPTGKEWNRNTPRVLEDGTKVWDT